MTITDHAHDLLGARVERQHVDQVKHQEDDEDGDEHASYRLSE
jgi:hypothetical protein